MYKLAAWFDRQVAEDWTAQVQRARALLQREAELLEIVQLVGTEALADTERGELAMGRLLREDFLQQSAFSNDAFCPLQKTYWMLKIILSFADHMTEALQRAVPLERLLSSAVLEQIARMKEWPPEATPSRARALLVHLATACREL